MPFTDKDLEAILEVALGKAPRVGIEPKKFESLYRASVAEIAERKANDVAELYNSLQIDAYYIESFQMRIKKAGTHPEAEKSNWDQIWNKVNTRFGTAFGDFDHGNERGNNKVYVWLEKDASGKGILHSYGNAHSDGVRRINMHYFVVVGDFDQLNNVVESFTVNPNDMSKFNKSVFDWKNKISHQMNMDGEPDLYTRMKELYVHTPKDGQIKIAVK